MSMIQTGRLNLDSRHPVATTGGDTSTFTRVTFPTPFPANSTVIVHATVQTFNGPETPGLRLHDVQPTGFLVRLNEINGSRDVGTSDGTHTTETIGWTAYTV